MQLSREAIKRMTESFGTDGGSIGGGGGSVTPASGVFWGQAWSNGGSVTGDMTGVGDIYCNGNYLLFKSSVNEVGLMVEGGITSDGMTRASFGFHPASQTNTPAWYNNKQVLQLKQSATEAFVDIPNGILQIGDGRFIWDATNGAIKVQRADGTAASFYATGGVSALGAGSGSAGSIDVLNATTKVQSPKFYFDATHYLYLDSDTLKYNDAGTIKTVVLQ